MDHNGFVPSPSLYHQHVLNDCHDGRRGSAQTRGGPAGHLELSHLVLLARLQKRNHGAQCTYSGYFVMKFSLRFEAELFVSLVVSHAFQLYIIKTIHILKLAQSSWSTACINQKQTGLTVKLF